MTNRERFLKTMHFEPVDRAPLMEDGAWGQTLQRWENEGMPLDVHTEHPFMEGSKFFGFDRVYWIQLDLGVIPHFEIEVIEETERYLIQRNWNGIITKALKEGTARGMRSSMDSYLDFPVKTKADFQEMKKRLNPSSPMRYPEWWEDTVKLLKDRDFTAGLPPDGSIGFYSRLREWMGTENACTIFYDDPVWAHEMVEFIADFTLSTIEQALNDVDADFFMWFEDYSFKTGPLISPKIFEEFLLSPYRRVNDRLRAAGIDVIAQDTDGNPEVLIPLQLKAGINTYTPIECAADQDPVKLRQKFGHDLLLWGGIDKRALAKDKKAIEKELLYKLPPLLEDGGYIPALDHATPPDVSYENWLYYVDLKRKIIEGRYGA